MHTNGRAICSAAQPPSRSSGFPARDLSSRFATPLRGTARGNSAGASLSQGCGPAIQRAATVRESETAKRPLPFRQSDNGRAKLLLSRTAGLMRASEQNSGRKARATGSGPSGTPPEQRPSACVSGSNAAHAFPFAASRETSSLQSTHTGKSGVIHCEKISPRSTTVAAHDCPIASR
jgi:hypothetical protein